MFNFIKTKIKEYWKWFTGAIVSIFIVTAFAQVPPPITPLDNASYYKDGTILLVKATATGVGVGRYEAGDIVEIRDGAEIYAKFGNGEFLGAEEKRKFLPIYLPYKLTDLQKVDLMSSDTNEYLNGEGELRATMTKRRNYGIDYTQILSASDTLRTRGQNELSEIHEIELTDIELKTAQVISVVDVPKHIALAEYVIDKIKPTTALSASATTTKTVDTGGFADYLSLSAFEAAEQADITAGGDNVDMVAELHFDTATSSADTIPVIIDGWTTDATHQIFIQTTASARHVGKWDETKYHLVGNPSAGDGMIAMVNDNITIEGVQVEVTRNIGIGRNVGLGNIRVIGNIIRNTGTGAFGISFADAGNDGDNYAINNIVSDFTTGIFFRSDSTRQIIYNNTVFNVTTGIRCRGNNVIVKNNVVASSTDAYLESNNCHSDSDDNAGDDASGPTNDANYTDISAEADTDLFVDPFNADPDVRDYHLASGSAVIDVGTDLSSDGDFAFTTDIDGDTRDASWDKGADEFVSAEPPAVSGKGGEEVIWFW